MFEVARAAYVIFWDGCKWWGYWVKEFIGSRLSKGAKKVTNQEVFQVLQK